MSMQIKSVAGVLALVISAAALAGNPARPQAQPTTPVPDEPRAPQSTGAGQTQTTPGQPQTTPAQAAAPAQGQLTRATAADLKAGAAVYDEKGGVVGKIESSTSKGAVVSTGNARVDVPTSSFGKNDKGLVISMTKAEIDAAAKKSSPDPK